MKLEAFKSRSWKDLTETEWEFLRSKKICNGCGGAGDNFKNRLIRWILKKILKRLRVVFFHTSCDIHDFTYWQGGDEARRKECDLGLFVSIIKDIERYPTGKMGVIGYTLLALAFYCAVRIGGKDYFVYS